MAEFPPSQGAKDLLAAHVAVSGWRIEIGAMPDKPDKIIMISDTGGQDPNPKWLLDFPTLQVMTRGAVGTYLDTFREAKAVKDLLLGIDAQVLNGDRWDGITQNGDLFFIGQDKNDRPIFSVNFALIIEPQVPAVGNRLVL